MSASVAPFPADLPETCRIRSCDIAAVVVFETIGHPNGDIRAGYCADHGAERPGIWHGSPGTYKICLSGPYRPRYSAFGRPTA